MENDMVLLVISCSFSGDRVGNTHLWNSVLIYWKKIAMLIFWLQYSVCRLILFIMDLTVVQLYWRVSYKMRLQVVPI